MDLIDRQAAKKVLLDERVADDDPKYENAWECNRFLEAAVERLNDLPTADVVDEWRLVRCKDCVWYDEKRPYAKGHQLYKCRNLERFLPPYFFCKDAVRIKDEQIH